ncbi:MAG: hypothetical protein C9356_12165 [Oleiphilus sp.]|nr:MAG: hypothetical protein C9356_12165 [Oleiphilus sp.]
MNACTMVATLKQHNQDYEWYPTTEEMLACIRKDLDNTFRYDAPDVLDCGAGDGRALKALTDGKKYAIERSKILISTLPHDVFILGTDFHEQTLIDKRVSAVFCNPPYKEFVQWMLKLIKEANAGVLYMVVPKRWKTNQAINEQIKQRHAEAKVLTSSTFITADRAARVDVDVVRISLGHCTRAERPHPFIDPFNTWINENFPTTANEHYSEYGQKQQARKDTQEHVNQELVAGGDLVEVLENHYRQQLATLLNNYQTLSALDPFIFSEMNITVSQIKGSLAKRISGLKDLYWEEFFNRLDVITTRLSSTHREMMIKKLTSHTHVDFTRSNARAITIWAIKNANLCLDQQIIDLVERMAEKANVTLYKSNKMTFGEENWRYLVHKQILVRYQLDYRVVLTSCGGVTESGLSDNARSFIGDICIVANSLGFLNEGVGRIDTLSWERNQRHEFFYRRVGDATEHVLFDVRGFFNGNLHIRFAPAFLERLNVEFGRLKGWLKDKQEAVQETGIDPDVIESCFDSVTKITPSTLQKVPELANLV